MAKFVMKAAFVEVNAVDISQWVSEVTIETTRDEVEVTGMGSANKETIAGLGDATITATVFQDFGLTAVDTTLWPLSTTNTAFLVRIRPTNAVKSTTNPEYTMTCLLFGYSPLSGGIGDASSTEITFKNATQAGLARATT